MENTMTNEVMEMVEDVDVIEVAEQYVPQIGVMDVVKGLGAVAVVGVTIYGGVRLVKDKIVPWAKTAMNKSKTEMVDCEDCDYTEAIDETDVEDEE